LNTNTTSLQYDSDRERDFSNTNPNKDYWDNIYIDYKYTVDGVHRYRKHDIVPRDNKIACFGCSNTYGIGLPINWTWPDLLTQKIGTETHSIDNYGVNGGSTETIARLVFEKLYVKRENYDAVFVLFPDYFRYEYTDSKAISTNLIPYNYVLDENGKAKMLPLDFVHAATISYSFFRFVKSYKLIKEVCNNRKIPFYWYSWSDNITAIDSDTLQLYFDINNTLSEGDNNILKKLNRTSKARDNAHIGVEYSQKLADCFYQLFKKR
jgi:hypothetical protein